eukprot:comp14764_c1_seq1/m.11177 comp14764_c1_seq1/g.11177  ORF comp14764_c1_seq1/g.11177 comp14764_c1_seq1/m.11177 type:complete len:161 (-) comp14764_c1_seq1:338-820(-)
MEPAEGMLPEIIAPTANTDSSAIEQIMHDDKLRFEVELEFVQMLASPNYLGYLAQHRMFEKPEFVNYIKYLQYWKQPQYARFLKWPQCLYFLDQLQKPHFQKAMMEARHKDTVLAQQHFHWRFYYNARLEAGRAEDEELTKRMQEELDQQNNQPDPPRND